MAIINFTGLEEGETQYAGSYGNPANFVAPVCQTGVVRSGTYAAQVNPTGTQISHFRVGEVPESGASNTTTAYTQTFFNVGTLPASGDEIFMLIDGANRVEFRITSAGIIKLYVYDGASTTLVGTGTNTLSTSTWYRINTGYVDSTKSMTLWINDIQDISVTLPNQLVGTTSTLAFEWGKAIDINGNTVNFYYDDIVVSDAKLVKDYQVVMLKPSSNGTYTQWTGDYTKVNEVPPDGNTTTISASGTTALYSTFNHGAVAAYVSYDAVKITSKISVASLRSDITLRAKSGTALYDFQITNPNLSGFNYVESLLRGDPATGGAWTQTSVNALETGIGIAGGPGSDVGSVSATVVYTNVLLSNTIVAAGGAIVYGFNQERTIYTSTASGGTLVSGVAKNSVVPNPALSGSVLLSGAGSVQATYLPAPVNSGLILGLLDFFSLEEASGNRFSAIDATHYLAPANPSNISQVPGIAGNAVSLANVTTNLPTLTSNFTYMPSNYDFTIGCWFNGNDPGTSVASMIVDIGTVGRLTIVQHSASNQWLVTAGYGNGLTSYGAWHHIVATYSHTSTTYTVDTYIDGSQVASQTLTLGAPPTPHVLTLNAFNSSANSVAIDEVGVWDRALSPTEVSTWYKSGAGNPYSFGLPGFRTTSDYGYAQVDGIASLANHYDEQADTTPPSAFTSGTVQTSSGLATYNPGVSGGATASGIGFQTYNETATGGVVISGVAQYGYTYIVAASGGAIVGGADTDHTIANPTPTSGAVVAGDSPFPAVYNVIATSGAIVGGHSIEISNEFGSGGAVASGVATCVVKYVEAGSGEAVVAGNNNYSSIVNVVGSGTALTNGLATVVFKYSPPTSGGSLAAGHGWTIFNITASGGVLLNGFAGPTYAISASGGAKVAGQAIVESSLSTRRYTCLEPDGKVAVDARFLHPDAVTVRKKYKKVLDIDGAYLPAITVCELSREARLGNFN